MISIKVITKNPALKAISLILAVILWLFVKSTNEGEVGLQVPIEFFHCPSSLMRLRCASWGPFRRWSGFPPERKRR
jgi:hypothetical protein